MNRSTYPKRWRPVAAEMLADKGFAVSHQQLSELRRGKITRPDLVEAFEQVDKELRKMHRNHQRRVARLLSAA